ncbi:hypothetical protein D3C85_1317650 [compost metagenome]
MSFGEEFDKGRMAFGALANRFHIDRLDLSGLDAGQVKNAVTAHVQGFYARAYGETSHYFRTLEEILWFVDSYGEKSIVGFQLVTFESISDRRSRDVARQRYARIVASSLSNAELDCLFIYCMAAEGLGLKTLVERYGLFKNMLPRQNIHNENIRPIYSQAAFKE